MVFNPTFTKARRRAGMTLVELMVATGIGSIVMTAVASLSFYTARSFAALSNYVELDQKSRNALDHMSQKIRQAYGVTSFSSSAVSMLYTNGSTLSYTYSPTAKTLTETVGSDSTTLLTECDALVFEAFARNPIGGTFNQFPATNETTTIKLLQVSWTCSRTIMGDKVNTESVQSAKIVIRKQ